MTDGVVEQDAGNRPTRVGSLELCVAFASIAVVGFGGVLPWIRWLLVDKKSWLTEEEFVNIFALCNFLPGGNVANIAVVVGARFGGFPGACAALAGLVTPPALIVVAIGSLYTTYGHLPALQSMFATLGAAAAGLVLSVAIRMIYPLWRSPRAVVVLAIVVLAAVVLRMPLVWMLTLIVPPAIAAAHWLRR